MCISLVALNGGYVDLNVNVWEKILKTARSNGWEPLGTVPHRLSNSGPEDWNGNYYSGDCQTICAEDTLAFAAALELAIAESDENSVGWLKRFIDRCRTSGGIMIS